MAEVFAPVIRRLPAERALFWLSRAWQLFIAAPAMWMGLSALLLVLSGLCTLLPVIGHLALAFFAPVFAAGLMAGCRSLDQQSVLSFEHLWMGFQHNTASLLSIGIISLCGHALISGLVMLLMGGVAVSSLFSALATGGDPAALLATFAATVGGIVLAALLGLILLTPLAMTLSFSPALAILAHQNAWPACKASFHACWKNSWPFFVLGVLSLLLLGFVLLTAGLAILVVMPVLIGALYAAYQDIFTWPEASAANPALPLDETP